MFELPLCLPHKNEHVRAMDFLEPYILFLLMKEAYGSQSGIATTKDAMLTSGPHRLGTGIVEPHDGTKEGGSS
jgi:hypothetical protein